MRLKSSKILPYTVIAIAITWVSFPLFWTITTAVKPDYAIFHSPPFLLPPRITLEHIKGVILGTTYGKFGFIAAGSILGSIGDSLIVALTNMILCVIIGLLAAYSIARFRTGGENLPFWIISNRFMPPIVFIIPMFIIFKFLRILDNYVGLILAYCTFNIPFATWLMIGFFEDLPQELEESAMVDGCNRIQAFIKIVLPLVAPGVAVTALFVFLFAWNEYIMAFLLTGDKVTTLPVYMPTLRGSQDVLYGEICAAAVISVIPAIILSFLLQRYLVRGLTLGAIK
jgi:multiple sugar transport system permease protein